MPSSEAISMMLLAALAGAVHVMAPDHWMPTSILSWQRGWTWPRTVAFATGSFLLHILMGVAIFYGFHPFLMMLDSHFLLGFGLFLVVSVMFLRLVRFSRIQEVLRSGSQSIWGSFATLSLLGPCESIIPILIKSGQLGMGYATPLLAFALGTVVAGCAAVLSGHLMWNRPLGLPLGLAWAQRSSAVLPVIAGLTAGLGVLLRMSG